MSDLGVDTYDTSSRGISSTLAASNDPPQSSVEAFSGAMADASNNRSAAEQSQSGAPQTPPADQTTQDHNGGGSWHLLDRGLGLLNVGVGGVEVAGGIALGGLTFWSGIGPAVGGVIGLHGVDDIQAGMRQAWTGEQTPTFTSKVVTIAAQHAGAPPLVAAAAGTVVDIAAGGGVGSAEKAAVKATEAAVKGTETAVKGTEAATKGTEAAGQGAEQVTKTTESAAAREIGILRDAAQGKGNFGLGSATGADAERLGRAWVGDGYKIASDGKTLVSADGLRQFRPPSFKPNLGSTQANFEQRLVPEGRWFSNGHLNITGP